MNEAEALVSPPQESSLDQSQPLTACPYAKAMKQSGSAQSLPGLVELQQCPAFSKECPFKSASSVEAVTEQLKRIPLGHMSKNGPLFQSLKYFHETSSGSGSCPVRNSISVPQDWSFHTAMEELSLVAVMAKLALEQESLVHTDDDNSSLSWTSNSQSEPTAASEASVTAAMASSSTLSSALKNGTASAHKAAESVHFVKNFIRGTIDRRLYGLLVAQLYHLYGKLEEALDAHAPKHFASCHFPKELHRHQALQEDLEFWHSQIPTISPATQDYIDRIEYLAKSEPLLLLAHAYTRYLGDLSGGKVLARVARRALNLKAEDDGLAFYRFPHVQSFKLFKDQYRSALDELTLTQAEIHSVVQEANVAFLLNMRLFEELDVLGGVHGASVRPLSEVYIAMEEPHGLLMEESQTSDNASCPFISRKDESAAMIKAISKCPWPFVVFHDRRSFFQAWQTWLLFGIILALLFNSFSSIHTPYSVSKITSSINGHGQNSSKKGTASPMFSFVQLYY